MWVFVALVAVILTLLYMLPTIVALGQRHEYRWPIAILNFLLGWSGIGWIALFVWALIPPRPDRPTEFVHYGAPLPSLSHAAVPPYLEPPKLPLPPPPVPSADPEAGLARIDRLLAEGTITAAEHENLRRQILAKLV